MISWSTCLVMTISAFIFLLLLVPAVRRFTKAYLERQGYLAVLMQIILLSSGLSIFMLNSSVVFGLGGFASLVYSIFRSLGHLANWRSFNDLRNSTMKREIKDLQQKKEKIAEDLENYKIVVDNSSRDVPLCRDFAKSTVDFNEEKVVNAVSKEVNDLLCN